MKDFIKETTETESLMFDHTAGVAHASSQGTKFVAEECLTNGWLATMDAWLAAIES